MTLRQNQSESQFPLDCRPSNLPNDVHRVDGELSALRAGAVIDLGFFSRRGEDHRARLFFHRRYLALRDWRSRKRDRMKHKPPP